MVLQLSQLISYINTKLLFLVFLVYILKRDFLIYHFNNFCKQYSHCCYTVVLYRLLLVFTINLSSNKDFGSEYIIPKKVLVFYLRLLLGLELVKKISSDGVYLNSKIQAITTFLFVIFF